MEQANLVEKFDELMCPECKWIIRLRDRNPLGRYVEEWRKNAENLSSFCMMILNLLKK